MGKKVSFSPHKKEIFFRWIDRNIGIPENGTPWSISDLASLSVLLVTCLGGTLYFITLYSKNVIPPYLYFLNERAVLNRFLLHDSLAGILTLNILYAFIPYAFMRICAVQINRIILTCCNKIIEKWSIAHCICVLLCFVAFFSMLSHLASAYRKTSFLTLIALIFMAVFLAKQISLKARLGIFLCLLMLLHLTPLMPAENISQSATELNVQTKEREPGVAYLHTTIADDKLKRLIPCRLERVGDLLTITTPDDTYHINIVMFSHFSPIEEENRESIIKQCENL